MLKTLNIMNEKACLPLYTEKLVSLERTHKTAFFLLES